MHNGQVLFPKISYYKSFINAVQLYFLIQFFQSAYNIIPFQIFGLIYPIITGEQVYIKAYDLLFFFFGSSSSFPFYTLQIKYNFVDIAIGHETRHLIGKQCLPAEEKRLSICLCRKTDIRKKLGQPFSR